MKYIPLFILIQLINIPLALIGIIICLLSYTSIPWLWRNDDDGAVGATWIARYVWLAWRNPVANLRHVRGVSAIGRPLWYWSNGSHYAKAGWMSDGYPCLSAGTGRGY